MLVGVLLIKYFREKDPKHIYKKNHNLNSNKVECQILPVKFLDLLLLGL
jgi:hypothetical protein